MSTHLEKVDQNHLYILFFLTKGGVYGLEIRRISEDLGAPYKIEILFLGSTTNKNNHQLYQNDL